MVRAGQVRLVWVCKHTPTLTHHVTAFDPSASCRLPLSLALSYVLECVSCGVIYRSRQYWMGNQDPESSVVRSEVKHVWDGVSSLPLYITSLLASLVHDKTVSDPLSGPPVGCFPDQPPERSSEGPGRHELRHPVGV